jgi:molecular chaperone HscB
MNYFEFYGIPISFQMDIAQLKRLFLAKSRQYHPDFYAQSNDEAQEQALEMATYNNKAYQTLSDLDQRIAYILTLKGLMTEGERYELPPAFLMQMMDINEEIMELETHKVTPTKIDQLNQALQNIENELLQTTQPIIDNYTENTEQTQDLIKIKEFYYKKRYLLRIQKSIRNFAPQ